MSKKLNVGCGTDYRDGFINIDGSNVLHKVDKVVDINQQSLLEVFLPGEIEFILINDNLEHHFHWEAVNLLKDFHSLLKAGGKVEIRVPDTEFILRNPLMSIQSKITMLYGGQDLPQGHDAEMDKSRKQNPQFFCHKYGWTRKTLKEALEEIGFQHVRSVRAGVNFIIHATK